MKNKIIINNIYEYDILVGKERMRYEKRVAKLDIMLKELQSRCPHDNTKFVGDPAGGNDSYNECIKCGKIF